MARHSLMVVLGLAAAVGVIVQTGSAGGKLEPVKVQAAAGKADGSDKQLVVVTVNIDKGWHIYANPVDNEDLIPTQTTVQVKAAGKLVAAKLKYPAGTPHEEKTIGTFKIYEDKVVIFAEFAKTDAEVEVSVRFQACDNKKCLLPKTVKLSVK